LEGEVHAIVGENGAGKSTLIKCITGCIEPTGGEILYDGGTYRSFTPTMAIQRGICAVYQEFNLVPYLSVAENIFLGREKMKNGFLDYEGMHAETSNILSQLGVSTDVRGRIKDLSVAYQQIVEIAKAVSRNVRLLILDEPSAPLTPPEIEAMFRIIRRLKDSGVTILYISHRLEEIFEIADRVTVMRDGEHIATLPVGETDRNRLISLMVGRELANSYPGRASAVGEVVLEARGLTNKNISGVSFHLKKGEILGLGGLVGAGRTETARAIFGADSLESGEVLLRGERVNTRSPVIAIGLGLGLIPEDRKLQGVLLNLSVRENITYAALPQISRAGLVDTKLERHIAEKYIAELRIKTPTGEQLVKNLSGGNQQKVILAKWMATRCDILIFDEPTRGIDVGAKQEIYKLMRDLSEEGVSIIMISSDMPELLGMSDRIVVMNEGRVVGEVMAADATQEMILEMASAKVEEAARC
ncbi:MAG: sugar ABC transporter ATP-binding protein, partial [Synergistaceae bacterium]|nr:sugar ABC transporter ATP-binding protein [Synergistaceae bacterium]